MAQTDFFHIYVDEIPTKGVAKTFEDAKRFAISYIENGKQVSIQTVNTLGPIRKWNYEQESSEWIEIIK